MDFVDLVAGALVCFVGADLETCFLAAAGFEAGLAGAFFAGVGLFLAAGFFFIF